MTLTLVDSPAATVLKLRGEFDLSNTSDVEEALALAADTDDTLIVVDLSEMTFAGTTVMRALLAGRTAAASRGKKLVVVRPTPIVWHAFEVMGLDGAFVAFDTLDSAVAASTA